METISTIKLIIQIILVSAIIILIIILIVLSTLKWIDKKLCELRRNEKKYKKFYK